MAVILRRMQTRIADAAEYHQATGMPYCTITYAQSIDGSIAASAGRLLALSGPESLVMTHNLRANHDAILIGIETVFADDPMLTVRLVGGEHPQPIVLDTNLRFPITARLLSHSKKPWLVTGDAVCPNRKVLMEQTGACIMPMPRNERGQVDLRYFLRSLGERGIRSLMIEGGARVIASFLELKLGNQLIITTSPLFVGGVRPIGTKSANFSYPTLSQPVYEQWGSDMVFASDLEW